MLSRVAVVCFLVGFCTFLACWSEPLYRLPGWSWIFGPLLGIFALPANIRSSTENGLFISLAMVGLVMLVLGLFCTSRSILLALLWIIWAISGYVWYAFLVV